MKELTGNRLGERKDNYNNGEFFKKKNTWRYKLMMTNSYLQLVVQKLEPIVVTRI